MSELPTDTPIAKQVYKHLMLSKPETFAHELVAKLRHGYLNDEQATHAITEYLTKEKQKWQQEQTVKFDGPSSISVIRSRSRTHSKNAR